MKVCIIYRLAGKYFIAEFRHSSTDALRGFISLDTESGCIWSYNVDLPRDYFMNQVCTAASTWLDPESRKRLIHATEEFIKFRMEVSDGALFGPEG